MADKVTEGLKANVECMARNASASALMIFAVVAFLVWVAWNDSYKVIWDRMMKCTGSNSSSESSSMRTLGKSLLDGKKIPTSYCTDPIVFKEWVDGVETQGDGNSMRGGADKFMKSEMRSRMAPLTDDKLRDKTLNLS